MLTFHYFHCTFTYLSILPSNTYQIRSLPSLKHMNTFLFTFRSNVIVFFTCLCRMELFISLIMCTKQKRSSYETTILFPVHVWVGGSSWLRFAFCEVETPTPFRLCLSLNLENSEQHIQQDSDTLPAVHSKFGYENVQCFQRARGSIVLS